LSKAGKDGTGCLHSLKQDARANTGVINRKVGGNDYFGVVQKSFSISLRREAKQECQKMPKNDSKGQDTRKET